MPESGAEPRELGACCCIVGGGPAGMMLGLLLARAGIEVVVLEKHADFLRDFRGDTIHPSTLEVIHELGLLDAFLQRPHEKVTELRGRVGNESFTLADFSRLPTRCKFIAFMPQWDFLDFIADEARRYPVFRLEMQAGATELLHEHGHVAGVRAESPRGALAVRADLVVGADGRHSTVRARAGLEVENLGAPMDVLWLRLSRRADEPAQALGHIDRGRIFIMLDRGRYWQCAYVIPKGGYDEVRRRGLAALRTDIARLVPVLHDRVAELRDWNEIKLLAVAVDRLRRWYAPGLLCIGDAAHAMSPIGGVGINLAIHDAVAAANILARPLRERALRTAHLHALQQRREWPTRMTQRLQVFLQNRVIRRLLGNSEPLSLPAPLALLQRWPFLRRIPARIIGMGFRPEHVYGSEN